MSSAHHLRFGILDSADDFSELAFQFRIRKLFLIFIIKLVSIFGLSPCFLYPSPTFLVFVTCSLILLPGFSELKQTTTSSSTPAKSALLSWIEVSPEDKFIINLINQEKFAECSLLILQDRFDNGQSVDYLLYQSADKVKSAYSIKYTFPLASELDSIATWLKELNLKLMSEVENNVTTGRVTTRESLPLTFPISVSNYRRKGSECLVVILMINDVRPEFLKQIYNMITPVYIPITRKDEDLYIFKTESKYHSKLLQMSELPSRIKFKIAVGYSKQGKNVMVRTVCFFCNPGGEPRQIQLPVDDHGLPFEDVDYFPDFVWDLNGKVLHVSLPYIRAKIEADPPWEGVTNARRGNWKMLFEKFLTVKFNFTYHMFVSTGKYGTIGGGGTGLQLKNGSWIGVTGDLISGKADLGIVIANTPKRIHYIDFTNSFYDIGCLTYVTAQPTEIYSPAALLWPFDAGMWATILFFSGLSVLFFAMAFKLMEKFQFGSEKSWPLSVQIQFLLSTFLEQDAPLPNSNSIRCFVSLWIFFTMVLTTVYRSKLVTLLAFPVVGVLPKTFEELAFSDYKVGFMKHGDSAYNTLKASLDPVYVKLIAEMEIFTGVGLECLENVMKYKYGCIAYDFALVHLRERNLSNADTRKLVFAPARTYNIWLGLGTEGKSIYRLNFGKMLSYTRQFHLADIWDKFDMYYNVRKLKLDWWMSSNQTDKMKHDEKDSDDLTLKHIAGAFYVLIACLAFSTVAFIHELLTHYRKALYTGVLLQYFLVKNSIRKWKRNVSEKQTSKPDAFGQLEF